MNALILYDSFTGNTEKVAKRIFKVLSREDWIKVDKEKIDKNFNKDIQLLDYDLLFIGSPVIQFLPSVNLMNFCKKNLMKNLKKGIIIPKSPKIDGKYAVVFVSFGGMHTGIREAIPALKYLEQFVEHLRFDILDEFYVVGEYRGAEFEKFNKDTVLGDITGRPNENDLKIVEEKVSKILLKLKNKKDNKIKIELPEILKFIEKDYSDLQEYLYGFINKSRAITSLTEKETILILIALSCFAKCKECFKYHVATALNIGITVEEIKDIILTGLLPAGASFVNFGIEMLKELGIE